MKVIVNVTPVLNPQARTVATAEVEFVDAGIVITGVTLRQNLSGFIFVNTPGARHGHGLRFVDKNDLDRFREEVIAAYRKARAIIDEQREAA